jgi:hypothetical protein
MRLAPFGVTLLGLAEHEAKSDAGLAIAVIAQLMHSDKFRLSVNGRLAVRRNGDSKRGGGKSCGE